MERNPSLKSWESSQHYRHILLFEHKKIENALQAARNNCESYADNFVSSKTAATDEFDNFDVKDD